MASSISLHHAYVIVIQCCASKTQCYQASICSSIVCIRHQYSCASLIWHNAVRHASIMAQFVTNLHHASKLCLSPVHHGSMLCNHGSLHDVHQASGRLNAVIRHQYGLMVCIRHLCGCIRHHINTAQTWALCSRLDVVHP